MLYSDGFHVEVLPSAYPVPGPELQEEDNGEQGLANAATACIELPFLRGMHIW